MLSEQQVLSLSPGDHIITFCPKKLRQHNILGSYGVTAVPNGEWVTVAELLVVHQSSPTAKSFHFLTLEDEDGMVNVIVNPQVYGRYRHIIRSE